MSTRTAALAVDVVSDVNDAVSGLGNVGDASRGASTDVARMGREAEESARRLNITADSADELGGKAGKATGALGALSSGFELLGPKGAAAATGLQSAALATDFFSGVGDSLNLVMESTIVKTTLAKAAAVGHGIATKASAAATGIMTGAQWALNAAMSANPIVLIVIGLAALAAGMVLAYKKSETVRTILKAVGRAGQESVGWIVDRVRDLTGWFRDKLPGGLRGAQTAASVAFAVMTAGPRTLIAVVTHADDAVRKLPAAFESAKRKAGAIAGALTKPFRDLWNLVDDIVDKIDDIDIPSLGDLNPFARTAGSTSGFVSGRTVVEVQGGPTYNYTFNLNGLLTDDEAADFIRELLDRRARQLGLAA